MKIRIHTCSVEAEALRKSKDTFVRVRYSIITPLIFNQRPCGRAAAKT